MKGNSIRWLLSLAAASAMLVACAGAAAAQQAGAIDSIRALRLAEAAVEAVNSGDSARIRSLVTDRLSPKALAGAPASAYFDQFMTMWRQSGGVDIRSAERFGHGLALTLWARRADAGIMLYASADRDDTTRADHLDALRAFHPSARVRPIDATGGDSAVLARIDAELTRLTAAGEFSGTVAISRRGRVVYDRGFGVADLRTGELNGAATTYHIASVGKTFTAVAIAQLVDAGRLSLDDPLAKALPAYHWRPAAAAVTVRQLLGHRSGLGQGQRVADSLEAQWADTAEPAFPPGTRWSYSNDGYLILAAIVERVSGQPFLGYLRRHVWAPAGMASAGGSASAAPRTGRATGYARADADVFGLDPRVPNSALVHGAGNGAGGEYVTAADLLRFAAGITSGRLLRRATFDSLVAPAAQAPFGGPYADERYAYGFVTRPVGDRRTFGHAGGGMGWGICARLDATDDGEWGVAVASNFDPPVCEDVSRAVIATMIRR